MKFKYADRVVVTEGFYEGLEGVIVHYYTDIPLFPWMKKPITYIINTKGDGTIYIPEEQLKLVKERK